MLLVDSDSDIRIGSESDREADSATESHERTNGRTHVAVRGEIAILRVSHRVRTYRGLVAAGRNERRADAAATGRGVGPVSGETQAPCDRCWHVDFVSAPTWLCDACTELTTRTTAGSHLAAPATEPERETA